jgi:hypothetical protein
VADRVINLHDYRDGWPPNTAYVGRGSDWGNPFKIGRDGERQLVLKLYRTWAERQLQRFPDWLKPLAGKTLACYCAPLGCHADILIELGA